MAVLGKWSGGSVTISPSTTWAAPANLFPTQDRNDSSTYSFTAGTSLVTLPSTGLADGYLIVGAFEYEDTSNGRHNPQARFIQASGTGNFVSGSSSGYNRDTSEDRSYVRTWAFVDNPSASSTFQFQWRRDTDSPTGGTVRSEFQIIPLYYSNHGIYSSTSTTCTGGTTPTQITGFTAVDESDTAAIEIASNVITLKGDNKRYLALGSSYWQGIGNARTQRWHGFRVDGTMDDTAKGYSYGRNAANADIGEMFTTIIDRATTDITVDQFIYRGPAVGAFPNAGGDVDGNTTGSNANHVTVILELNDSAEVFRSHSTTQQDIDVAGTRVDLQIADTVDFNDSASFAKTSATEIDSVQAADVLLGANVSGGYASSTTARYTGYSELTINGTGQSDTFAGDYGRGDQGTQDCWGWSANLMSFVSPSASDELGVNAGKISGGEGGTVDTFSGWVGFWGVNLDTLEATGGTDVLTADDVESSSEVSAPTLASVGGVHNLLGEDIEAQAEVPSASGGGITKPSTSTVKITTGSGNQTVALPSSVEDDYIRINATWITAMGADNVTAQGWTVKRWDNTLDGTAPSAYIYKKMGSTPDTSIDLPRVDIGAGDTYCAVVNIAVLRGVDTSTPIDVALTGPSTGGGASMDSPSVTTITDGALVETLGHEGMPSWAFTAGPSGYSDVVYDSFSAIGGAVDVAVLAASKIVATAGTENPGAWNTNTTTPDGLDEGFTVAWRPAAGGGDAPVLTEIVSEDDDLLADDIESASEVSSPVVGQTHSLGADDVQSTSEVSAPTLVAVAGTDDLLADDVQSSSETSSPSVGQEHALAAGDVESQSEVSSPAIGQVHDLASNDTESNSEISEPSVGQEHNLLATSVESASEVTEPNLVSVAGTDNLLADDVESLSEVSAPSVGQIHDLTTDSVESGSEVSFPSVGQSHGLSADSVESNSELTDPSIGQAHDFNADSVESNSEVSEPNLVASAGVTNLFADDIETTSEVGSPSVGQIHSLEPEHVESASEPSDSDIEQIHNLNNGGVESTSEVTTPTLSLISNLLADDVESTSEVSAPELAAIAGVNNLLAEDIESSTEVTTPSVTQVHDLDATDVETTTEVSAPFVSEVNALTADDVQSTSEVSEPTVSEFSELSANDVESVTEVSAPTVSEIYNLNVVDIQSYTKVSNPSINQVNILLADDIESTSEVSSATVIILPFVITDSQYKDL